MLAPDLAAAVARSGVGSTPEPRPLQDALKGAIADRGGYLHWELDDCSSVVELLHPVRDEFRAQTLRAPPPWCPVFLMAEEVHG